MTSSSMPPEMRPGPFRKPLPAAAALSALLTFACAHDIPLQANAPDAIDAVWERRGTVDDVSRIVGAKPRNCAPRSTPGVVLGIDCYPDQGGGVVAWRVAARSPAAAAGIRAGDRIASVDGRPVARCGDLRGGLESVSSRATEVVIVTDRGPFPVQVRRPARREACAWEVGTRSAPVVRPGDGISGSANVAVRENLRIQVQCDVDDGVVVGYLVRLAEGRSWARPLAEAWTWNGFRLGMPIDEARGWLDGQCKVRVVARPDPAFPGHTELSCPRARTRVADGEGALAIRIDEVGASEITFALDASARSAEALEKWFAAVLRSLDGTYGADAAGGAGPGPKARRWLTDGSMDAWAFGALTGLPTNQISFVARRAAGDRRKATEGKATLSEAAKADIDRRATLVVEEWEFENNEPPGPTPASARRGTPIGM